MHSRRAEDGRARSLPLERTLIRAAWELTWAVSEVMSVVVKWRVQSSMTPGPASC